MFSIFFQIYNQILKNQNGSKRFSTQIILVFSVRIIRIKLMLDVLKFLGPIILKHSSANLKYPIINKHLGIWNILDLLGQFKYCFKTFMEEIGDASLTLKVLQILKNFDDRFCYVFCL